MTSIDRNWASGTVRGSAASTVKSAAFPARIEPIESSSPKIHAASMVMAITIDAAWILGLEDSIGSIRAGKAADFTVLAADPLTVPLAQLRSIEVIGTVFAGTAYQN